MAVEILKRMKYDNNTISQVRELVFYHDVDIKPKISQIKRFLNKVGDDTLRQLIEVKRADIKAQSKEYMDDRLKILEDVETMLDEIILQQQCFSLKDLAINGKDLIDIGCPQGHTIGVLLNNLIEMVLDELVENDKGKLLEIAKIMQ